MQQTCWLPSSEYGHPLGKLLSAHAQQLQGLLCQGSLTRPSGSKQLDQQARACLQVVELPGHPFYVGAQFHPEFKSRPGKPSALFLGLVLAAAGKLDNWLSGNPLSPARPLKRPRAEGQGSSQAAKEPKQEPDLMPKQAAKHTQTHTQT